MTEQICITLSLLCVCVKTVIQMDGFFLLVFFIEIGWKYFLNSKFMSFIFLSLVVFNVAGDTGRLLLPLNTSVHLKG